MPFVSTALAVGLGVSAAAGIGTAAIGAHAAGQAAQTQSNAADYAANLQHQDAQAALDFQKQQYTTNQANEAPWLKAGQGAVTNLSSLLAPGGDLTKQWTGEFQAPTAAEAAATPGYQFQLQQGEQALQNSAAAQGNLLTGGTAKALDQYSQGLASTNYQQAYNNALTQYQQSYNQFQQGQANQYNRLAGLAGLGQTSAGQLSSAGQSAANNVSNIMLGSGQQIGNDVQNAAAARASGYVGSANAYGGALSNVGSNIGQYATLASLLNANNGSSATQAIQDYGPMGGA